ncbi:hypothetical protein V7S43_007459 [Phytophthora oleae]
MDINKLKYAIKDRKPDTITCEADLLHLFLAKKDKGLGEWLTQADVQKGARDTSDYKRLRFPGAKLRAVGLASNELGEVSDEASAAGLGPIHVLVKFPKILRMRYDEDSEIIASYRKIADRLKDNKEVESLSKLLADVRVEGEKGSTPFVVLENSSGTGKTQMAFNLEARGERDVFYIVCSMHSEKDQTLYNAFGERTKTFRACVRSDLETMKEEEIDDEDSHGSVGEIRGNTTLVLYGFILAALRGSGIYFRGVQRPDVQDELSRRKQRGAKPFVFFLDEFPRARRHDVGKTQRDRENFLRVMRNVFCSFDLAVVLSSTNGTARSLIAISGCSRGSGSCLWCVVIPSLLCVDINGDYGIPELLMTIIKHSRPLFANLALEYVQANPYNCSYNLNDYLTMMAGTLATRFKAMKKQSDEFKMGQLCLLLGTSYKAAQTQTG